VNREILQHCFFLVRQHWGGCRYCSFLPYLMGLSCNWAVDWITKCFCCERVLQKRWESGIAQREFRRDFGIHRNHAVRSVHVIKTWVRNFEATGSTLKKKGGSVKTVRTPESIAVVTEAIDRSPHSSAGRTSVSFGLSEASLRRILHKDLHF
jgi:transposase